MNDNGPSDENAQDEPKSIKRRDLLLGRLVHDTRALRPASHGPTRPGGRVK